MLVLCGFRFSNAGGIASSPRPRSELRTWSWWLSMAKSYTHTPPTEGVKQHGLESSSWTEF